MIQLYEHQLKTFDFGITHGSYADLSEMGTGKTISALSVVAYEHTKNPDVKVMVVAPKSIIMSGWVRDCERAYPKLKIIPVLGTAQQQLDAFNEKGNIYVTNYETFHQNWDFSDENFTMLICDEAVKLKNHRAKWTKAIAEFARSVDKVIILSGLITPNNMMEIYSPFDMIEKGVLGQTFWQFRERFFTIDPWSHNNTGYIPKKGAEDKITDILSPYIIRHTKEECLDLPEKVHTTREVPMTDKQRSYYRQMELQAVLKLQEQDITASHKASILSKLAQISSGFAYDEDKTVHKLQSGKIDELDDIINGELSSEQVLVFINFRAEAELFREKYPEASFITGGQKTADQEWNIENFKNGNNRICFANISASKYGLTLINTNNVIYYSLNYSLDDYAQSQDRIHRIGQTKTCNYIYLLSTFQHGKTVDHRIYEALMGKKSLNELIVSLIEQKQ